MVFRTYISKNYKVITHCIRIKYSLLNYFDVLPVGLVRRVHDDNVGKHVQQVSCIRMRNEQVGHDIISIIILLSQNVGKIAFFVQEIYLVLGHIQIAHGLLSLHCFATI